MYTTYIFDLDGTLLDTLDDLAASVNYALRTHGMPGHSTDDVRRFVGNGVRKLMERAVPDGADNPLFEEAFATFRQHYMTHSLDTTRPYKGIPETLAALKARGCRLAVVSNKMMAATQSLCTVSMRQRGFGRNLLLILSLLPWMHWEWGRNVPSMWGIVMWISRRPEIVASPVSLCSGDFVTETS